jgi:hypothetical protein
MTNRYPGEDAFPPSLRGLGIAPNIAPTVVAPLQSAPHPLPYGSFEGTNRGNESHSVTNFILHLTASAGSRKRASDQLYFANLHNTNGRKARIEARSRLGPSEQHYFACTPSCAVKKYK